MARFVFTLVAAIGTTLCTSSALAHGDAVTIERDRVAPQELVVPAGTVVHFQNEDDTSPERRIVADDESWRSPASARGGGWHQLFSSPGVYPDHLEPRPSARGTITVAKATR